MSKTARSYPGLDLMRLLAAVLVALYHFGYLYPVKLGNLPVHGWTAQGWVGVQVFFVISGFVIAFSASRKDTTSFVVSRAGRLYPAAWICATITMLASSQPFIRYIKSLTLFPYGPAVSGVYWTLDVEITFYALVALAMWREWSLHKVAIALGIFSSLSWALLSFNYDLPVGYLGRYGCYFALGMLLYERRSLVFSILFFAVGFFGNYLKARHLGFGFSAPYVWAGAILLCVAAVFWNGKVERITRSLPTRTLGLMTYPLYLIHDTVGIPAIRFGLPAALAVSLLVAFCILPLEEAIRKRLLAIPALFDRKTDDDGLASRAATTVLQNDRSAA